VIVTPNIKFLTLTIKNGRVFKKLDIILDAQGLVLILGKNGAGKSTIWAMLEAIIYASTPSGHRRDELVKSDEDAQFDLELEVDSERWIVSYCREKGKWKHYLTTNGLKRNFHGATESAKAAAQVLGLSKAEFEGSVHLTQASQHVLISGSPADRKKYISDFFGIDERYDFIKQSAEAELAKVDAELSKIANYSHTLTVVDLELAALSFTDTQPYKTQLVDCDAKLAEHYDLNETYRNIQKDLELYETLKNDAAIYENPKNVVTKLENQKANMMASLANAKTIKRHNQMAAQNNATLNSLEKELVALSLPGNELIFTDDFEIVFNKLQAQRSAYAAMLPQKNEFDSLPSNLSLIDTDLIGKEINAINASLIANSQKLQAIAAGKCPTCHTKFESTHKAEIERDVAEQTAMVNSLHAEFKAGQINNEKYKRYQYLKGILATSQQFTEGDQNTLNTMLRLAPSRQRLLQVNLQLKTVVYVDLQEDVDVSAVESALLEVDADLNAARRCLLAQEKLPAKPKFTEEQLLNFLNENALAERKVQQDKNEILSTLGRLKAENDRHQRLTTQANDLRVKVGEIDNLKKDQFFWQKMVDAYGPKGIRVQQLERIMKIVLERLPFYTSILFEDKSLSFFHKCDSNNIEIFAKRSEGAETYEHDISSFSGGEQRSLSVAFVLTLADCVPVKKRSNILILDEVDTNLDKDAEFRFVNHLLPLLKTRYSSVFLISHSEEVQQAAIYDQIWKIKKENHWSTLEMTAGA